MDPRSPKHGPVERTHGYMAAAEPSWSRHVSAQQLLGLLSLSALLSERVYLSDVHVGDNPHFLASFLGRKSSGLYERLRGYSEAGLVTLLLRDETIRPYSATPVTVCETFSDVYASWLASDSTSTRSLNSIVGDRDPEGQPRPERIRFFEDVDGWLRDGALERYRYRVVKRKFMAGVRDAYGGTDPWLRNAVHSCGAGVTYKYEQMLEREWFSLGDMYNLFQRARDRDTGVVMMAHGLLNEVSYGKSLGAAVVGADVGAIPFEDRFWALEDRGNMTTDVRPTNSVQFEGEVLDRASRVLDAPALSVLGLLTPAEVFSLRSTFGVDYFDMLRLVAAAPEDRPADIERRFVAAAADYWEGICDRLSQTHRSATHRPRKLAIMLGMVPSSVRQLSRNAYTFGVNVGVPAAAELATPASQGVFAAANILRAGCESALRFVFFAEADELRKLRRALPPRPWITPRDPAMPS